MIFIPLGLAHVGNIAFPYYRVASATKKFRHGVRNLFRTPPRKVISDEISIISDLSFDVSFDEHGDFEGTDMTLKYTMDNLDQDDDDSYYSCNSDIDDWHSTVSRFASKERERRRDPPVQQMSLGSGEFSIALKVVRTFLPLQRMVREPGSFGLLRQDEADILPLEPCTPTVEDSDINCHNGDAACLYVLYDKKGLAYQFFKHGYEVTKRLVQVKNAVTSFQLTS